MPHIFSKRMLRRCTKRRLGLLFVTIVLWSLPSCHLQTNEQVQFYNDDGVVLFRQGNIQGAKESFEEALALRPGDVNLTFNLARCYDFQGDFGRAEDLYRRCLERTPNHPECRHAFALLLLKTGRRREMDGFVEDWLAKEPTRADPYIEDAWRLRLDGEVLHAKGRLHQALELEPRNVRALTELGVLFEQIEYPERARALYERALEIDPRQPEIADRLNQLCAKGIGRPRPN